MPDARLREANATGLQCDFSKPKVGHVTIHGPLDKDRICLGHRGVWWAEIETQGRIAVTHTGTPVPRAPEATVLLARVRAMARRYHRCVLKIVLIDVEISDVQETAREPRFWPHSGVVRKHKRHLRCVRKAGKRCDRSQHDATPHRLRHKARAQSKMWRLMQRRARAHYSHVCFILRLRDQKECSVLSAPMLEVPLVPLLTVCKTRSM